MSGPTLYEFLDDRERVLTHRNVALRAEVRRIEDELTQIAILGVPRLPDMKIRPLPRYRSLVSTT